MIRYTSPKGWAGSGCADLLKNRRHDGLGPVFLHEMTGILDSNTGLLGNQFCKTLSLRIRNPLSLTRLTLGNPASRRGPRSHQ